MAYLQDDVHDLNNAELGNLVITTLATRDVIMVEVRLVSRRRTMRVWYDDGGPDEDGRRSGDPIDQDELDNPL